MNLSQDDLAEIVYVSRQTISNWETGKSYPDLKSLLLMSDYFDVSLDELVKGDLQMMKERVDATILNHYSLGMVVGFVVMIFGAVFYIKTQKNIGMVMTILGASSCFIQQLKLRKSRKSWIFKLIQRLWLTWKEKKSFVVKGCVLF